MFWWICSAFFHSCQQASVFLHKKCNLHHMYQLGELQHWSFCASFACIHYGVLTAEGCRQLRWSLLSASLDAGLTHSRLFLPMCSHTFMHTHTHTNTGLIVLCPAPLPHYLYNCMSETFSSVAKPSLHNADKHPSHDNSPLGHEYVCLASLIWLRC